MGFQCLPFALLTLNQIVLNSTCRNPTKAPREKALRPARSPSRAAHHSATWLPVVINTDSYSHMPYPSHMHACGVIFKALKIMGYAFFQIILIILFVTFSSFLTSISAAEKKYVHVIHEYVTHVV